MDLIYKKYEKLQKSNKTYIDSEILILNISKIVFNNANYLLHNIIQTILNCSELYEEQALIRHHFLASQNIYFNRKTTRKLYLLLKRTTSSKFGGSGSPLQV